jgi:signal transduction histidine kinase/CheY-like chemotaxis protein
MDIGSLQAFLEPIPVCFCRDGLSLVLEHLKQTRCDRILVIDDRRLPIGMLTVSHLLPHLFPGDLNLPNPALHGSGHLDVSQSIMTATEVIGAEFNYSLLKPVASLAIQSSLAQVLACLREDPDRDCALVNEFGYPLGMLNRIKLWQQLTDTLVFPGNASENYLPESGHLLNSQLSDRLSNQKALIGQQETLLTATLQLLEQLPLPLMVQTDSGQIVSQNLAWQQQLGALDSEFGFQFDVDRALSVSHDASAFGESMLYASRGRQTVTAIHSDGDAHLASEAQPYSGASLCSPGYEPNTCLCVYPAHDGEEYVWKFTKVPLHLSLFQLGSDRSSTQALSHHDANSTNVDLDHDNLWLVLAQDATRQQQATKKLTARNADLTQINRLKDEFLACVSHELKTPLTAILGLSGLLREQKLGNLNERQHRYAELIHQSGRRLISIVNDILDLTRIEMGQIQLSFESVKIRDVCEAAYRQAQQLCLSGDSAPFVKTLSQLESAFSLEIEPGLESVIADEMRLRQMLVQLIVNAIKFTPMGGTLGIRVTAWAGWIAFTVWDTGVGIPADQQYLIFQKFQQIEHPLTRQFEGTGLGLVLTQRLAQLHGGDVSFVSAEGSGSEFTLLLPLDPSQVIANQPVQADPSNLTLPTPAHNQLVLVVEAMPQSLEHSTTVLTKLGYRVAIARSGTEAIGKIRQLRPLAILLNPDLPLLSGWDVLALLKTDPQISQIPVVVTAADTERKLAHRNGATGFLSLPIQPNVLQQALEAISTPQSASVQQGCLANLTILHLKGPYSVSDHEVGVAAPGHPVHALPLNQNSPLDLNHLLHPYHCRVLEVDDLDQAGLLARVWKPDVILIDGAIAEPGALIHELSQHPYLAALPLVTLTPEVTQAANQFSELAVFPCLDLYLPPFDWSESTQVTALIQVIQVATGRI